MVEKFQVQPQPEDESNTVRDEDKTKEQLISDLVSLQQRVRELEAQVAQASSPSNSHQNLSSDPSEQREQFIARIAQTIRQSLDLQQMLNVAVEEVRHFLQIDRVVVYRFRSSWSGEIIAESVGDPSLSLMHREIYDPCFDESMASAYLQGRIHHVNDVTAANLSPCYVELLAELNVRAVLVLPILVRQELWGLLVAHQCSSPRQWQELNCLLLQQLSVQLAIGIHQAELYQRIQQQTQQEQALNQVIQEIRNSLDLNTIFATATHTISRVLELNRVEIVQYRATEKVWTIVASYRRDAELVDATGLQIPDQDNVFAAQLKRGEVVPIVDYQQEADRVNQQFVQDYPGSWLLVPLEVGSTIWGSLSLNRSLTPTDWQEWEVELGRAIANQLSIAIQQSQLYQAVRGLNNQLEEQVETRTAQLQQVLDLEDLLKRITDKVRDSLDENYILQTAVEELASGLHLRGCDTALYDLNQRTATICREYLHSDVPPARGRVVHMAEAPDLYAQLLSGETTQFCHSRTPWSAVSQSRQNLAILACPMIDHCKVIGDMWLFKAPDSSFDSLEIRLVQQVANHCAIALRQSRLYQTAQAQVRELERLNQLKDVFLSTVSHELRTPMSNIKMATRMLGLVLFGDNDPLISEIPVSDAVVGQVLPEPELVISATAFARLRRYFRVLQDECQREISLINDLLDLSQLESEANPVLLSAIDLGIWLPQVAATFADRLQQQQQRLQLQLPEILPTITTDLRYLERIFTELLVNACKYTPVEEEIVISVEPQPNQTHLLIQVKNSGVEIPEAERDRIFETFYRIPNNDPWRYSGTGLGLALVKKLIERLRGSIAVESGDGQTCFVVQLPLQYYDGV